MESETIDQKPSYHHGDLRVQLLEAVRRLVEEKGAEGFSIAEAARAAGVSSAAPYRHFQDKPEILKALVMDEMDAMSQSMEAVISPHPLGSIERLNALGKHYIDYAKEHPGMFRLIFGITEHHEGDEDLRLRGEGVFGIVIKAVADFLNIDVSDPKAKERAYLLWTFVHGHSWLVIDGKARRQGIVYPDEHLLEAVSNGILISNK